MAEEHRLLELIAGNTRGVLAAVTRDGYPHMTNVLYVWDAQARTARVSTTADRVKGRILGRDPRAALHVPGPDFWSYAVAECDADLTAPATTPGDEACRELLAVHSVFYGRFEDEPAFFAEMIANRRLVVRMRVRRTYGVIRDESPGG
jgi:PPOX class probable F420-dependent enzyme